MRELRQYLTEWSYVRQVEVTFGQCDRGERLRIAGILDQAASMAGYDYDARGMTRAVMLEMGYAFLLSRAAFRIHRCPRYGDILTIQTWEDGIRGAHMQRAYEMKDQTGRLCVSARSDWILVHPETHKIRRPRSLVQEEFHPERKCVDCPSPRRIVLPGEGLEELGTRRVNWSDLDGNGHLYSGKYGDIVWDFLPEDLQPEVPAEFYIQYSKEAALGQELRMRGLREEHAYRIEGVGESGVCFVAMCVY